MWLTMDFLLGGAKDECLRFLTTRVSWASEPDDRLSAPSSKEENAKGAEQDMFADISIVDGEASQPRKSCLSEYVTPVHVA